MKKIILLLFILAFIGISYAQESVVFYENFESDGRPTGWAEEKVIGLGGTGSVVSWQYTHGGYYDYPENPAQGVRNAMFQLESDKGETTILITPPIDLSDIAKPELRFAHVQQIWENVGTDYWDRLNVYYKRGFDSSWVLLEEYPLAVSDWVDRSILLPDSSKSSTYYIGFEGITGFGWGVCIDTMRIVETGAVAKYIDSYTINQASTDFIPTNTQKNPILNINFNIKGNSGNLYLDSLKVTSLNTIDDNIINNGVKLYATTDSIFRDPILIASGVTFDNGIASFQNINYDLPRGNSTVWITYDIAIATDHDIHNNIADAKIATEGIYVNGYGFPFVDKSPSGQRLIKEAIFIDSFESDLGWILNGSFEMAAPQGYNVSGDGNPDPTNAFSGSKILGTDLLGDGNYARGLENREDSAVSPNFDCLYYKDVNLYFARWLNNHYFDKAYIDISNDNKNTWTEFWSEVEADDSWKPDFYDLNGADFKENVSIRFGLGITNASLDYTGWNIDDFIIIGDFISKDVGITGITLPENGCGHTVSDDISVYIENYAGEATPSSIPLRYSIDGSETYTVDAYSDSPIAITDSASFTFSVGANISAPGPHTIKVQTILEDDEISSNNSLTKSIFSFPTLTLPYSEDFETNYGYYLSAGKNSTWEYGTPSGFLIDDAASGTKAWVTNLSGPYPSKDSTLLLTPCFDFTGVDSVVFEFKCKGVSEDKTDGLSILYSINQGTTWDSIPNNHDYYWNWYNEASISALGFPGLDNTNNEWTTYRQLLPPETSDLSSVKFRFIFKSDASNNLEGFGIDDIKIYEAPADVGVTSLDYPFTDCEWKDTTHVRVYVENYGITDVKAGTKIPLKLNFESEIIYDTLTLASDLVMEDSVLFLFNSTVDMSYAGDFDFVINTDLEANTYFYNETVSNDTMYETVIVQGMPNYDPFPVYIGVDAGQVISVDLDALADDYTYAWSTAETSQTINVDAVGTYSVTITNGASCQAEDSVDVIGSLTDITVNSILTDLEDSCEITERTQLTELSINITNNGLAHLTLIDEDTIFLAYQINELPIVEDTFVIVSDFNMTTSTDFIFKQKCDLLSADEYTIKVFHNFPMDLNPDDDTKTSLPFNTWKYPEVNFAYDTIYSSQADTLTLDAGSGFASYLWNLGDSITQTITPTNSTYYYYVTVTDVNGCGSDIDSTYIETHDLGISDVTSPVDICIDDIAGLINVDVEVTNYSDSVYTSSSETIYYEYDGGSAVPVNPTITVGALGTVSVNIGSINAGIEGEHTLKIYTSSNIDANHTNDTLEYTFNTWPLPDVDLAYETIFTTRADTVILVAQEGFGTYAWSDGTTTTNTLIVTDNFSEKYVVTVTDVNGCDTDKDSTLIYTYNLGISELIAPSSDCEHSTDESVTVSIENYSNDIMKTDSVIPVGYKLNGASAVIEYYTLEADLGPSETVNYTFTAKVDLQNKDTYRFDLFTDFEFDVVVSNDTLVDVIKTFGYPSIELGDDILTTDPTSVVLTAPTGFNHYIWDDGTTSNPLSVTYEASKLYSLTVTDINGCPAIDDINVFTYDVAASELNTPFSQCELTNTELVDINVINNSLDTLLAGETIDVRYILNSGAPVNESFNLLVDSLKPSEKVSYTFTQTADLSINQVHSFELFAQLASIDVETNDEITRDVDYQKSIFDLGADASTPDAQYIIDAGAAYTDYLWFDDSDGSTYTADINNQNSNNYYAVTVTNSDACTSEDSITVTFTATPDLEVSALVTPISDCWVELDTYPVQISIRNSGIINLNPSTSITLGYRIDNGTAVTETIVLASALNAGATLDYTFPDEISFASAKSYEFKPFVKLANDETINNDTLTVSIDISRPDFDLGADINYDGSQYIIDAGTFTSYEWFDGSDSQTYTVDVNDQNPSHIYAVTVTDSDGCKADDEIEVTFTTTPDLELTALITPVANCWIELDTYPVEISIRNSGVINLNPSTSISVGYRIDNGTAVTETIVLASALNVNETLDYTFPDEISFASSKIYEFKPFVKLADDEIINNDTLTVSVDISSPDFDLGPDINSGETQHIIDAGTFDSYEWFDGSDSQTYTVDINDQNPSHIYAVTVTDSDDCMADDSIEVTFTNTPDLEVTEMFTPISDCWDNTETYPVRIEITNSGVVNLNAGTSFTVGYAIDGVTADTETIDLSEAMNASDIIDHTFTNEVSFSSAKVYLFEPFVKLSNDGNATNDTLDTYVDISSPDVILGANDTISTYDPTYIISTSESYLTYLWSDDDNSTTPTITVTQTGHYSVTITDQYGCYGEGSIYISFLTTDIKNLIQGDGYKLTYFPNPVSEKLMIQFENKESKDIIIEIIGSNGQTVYSSKISNVKNTTERIDVTPFSNGIYFIRFKIDDEFYIRKLIIQ